LPVWLRQQPLAGRLKLAGRSAAPALTLESTLAGQHPLLGPWSAAVEWRDGLLRLDRLRAEGLEASAQLPLDLKGGRGLVLGAWGAAQATAAGSQGFEKKSTVGHGRSWRVNAAAIPVTGVPRQGWLERVPRTSVSVIDQRS
jgi:hypothetical protein